MNEQVYSYIGRCKCGQVVAATVDTPEYQRENAKEVGKWMRAGLTIERHPVEYVREHFGICTCPQKRGRSGR